MFRYCVYLFFFFLMIAACKPLPNVQGKGEVFMQGIWNEDTVASSDQLLNYTQHKFKFTCDSFYVDLVTHSKVNYYADSCFNKGVWKEYAKGIYEVRNDSLFLEGTYTKSNYKQKVSGCYQIGRYLKTFYIRSKSADRLMLESTNDQRECALVLKEKIICTPKSL
ncbi:MAG: fumarate hydratase [Pedobacter sp.]|nr:MAG: fumarate hydratase [Pedobacter sp.]